MRITVYAIGSRGDVQPYVALGRGLQAAGHQVRFASQLYFKDFAAQYGLIDFFPLASDMLGGPDDLRDAIGQWVHNCGANPVCFMRIIVETMQPMARQALDDMWAAAQGADAIIFSTLAVPGHMMAETLGIPAFWGLLYPFFSRTRAMPNGLFPSLPLGGPLEEAYNLLTHILLEQSVQQAAWSITENWRQEVLGLPPRSRFIWPYRELNGKPLPVLYGYSPSILDRPPDWGDHLHVTGYWFLPRPADYTPPADLVDFIAAGAPPVYLGFGSMTFQNPEELTGIVLAGIQQAGVRAILLTGWGGIAQGDLPETIFKIEAAPHDWLFPQMQAVVHHGGAGTTSASLRSGQPSILVPFLGDQPFWGRTVQQLGVGPAYIPREKLTPEKLAYALRIATTHAPMRQRAAALGANIRAEDGIAAAVRIIEAAV